MSSVERKGWEHSRVQGRAESIGEGKAESRHQALQAILQRQLALKFGAVTVEDRKHFSLWDSAS